MFTYISLGGGFCLNLYNKMSDILTSTQMLT